MDSAIYCKDVDINEVWAPGVAPDGPPWGKGSSTGFPEGKKNVENVLYNNPVTNDSYEDLQKILTNAGLPKTEDRTNQPRTGYTDDTITICVAGSPSFSISVLLEGARQCPGNLLLCLSTSWFCPRPPAIKMSPPLYVRQAVTFDRGGRTFLDTFSPPRRVTYLSWLGGDHHFLREEWDCPMGGSPKLSCLLSDTLFVRLLLDQNELPLPTGLLFTPPSHIYPSGELNGDGKATRVVLLDGKQGWEDIVKNEIFTFLALLKKKEHRQVVVKSCGSQLAGTLATTFYSCFDPVHVSNNVLKLLRKLQNRQAILLEGFITTFPPRRICSPKPPPIISRCSVRPPELTIRLCAVVCRSRGDQPMLSKVVCAVGRAEKPLCHRSALPQSLDTILEMWGVTDKGHKENVWAQLKETAERTMRVVMEQEKKLTPEERGGHKAQTDILGIDFLLTLVDCMVTPVILGLNSGICLESCGIQECMMGSLAAGIAVSINSASRPLVETMLRRSLNYVMEGKEILVIGAGGISKKFIWEAAREYGIKIHLVESDPGHFASSLVASFIHYDFEDHSYDDEEHAKNLLHIVKEKGLVVSGCMAFWDECTILAAHLSHLLQLHGPPPSAVRLAKRKTQTQLCLLSLTSPIPPFPYAGAFAVPCCSLDPETGGLERAESILSYPLVLKPESGAGAVGVRLVQDKEECRKVIGISGTDAENGECKMVEDGYCKSGMSGSVGQEEVCKFGIDVTCGSEVNGNWSIEMSTSETLDKDLSIGTSPDKAIGVSQQSYPLFLSEYITGSEHDVDLVLGPNGRLLAAYVSDNGPTILPGFTETAAALPSRLGAERRCQLVTAAARSCQALGLFPGVFNVELKLTECGPRLLEINPRMGGFYLRDWIRRVYGTDLVMVALALFCGIDPALPEEGTQANTVLVGVMCTGERHEEALSSTANPQRLLELNHAGYIRFNRLEGTQKRLPDQEPYGNVACEGVAHGEARRKLLGLCEALGLDSEEYPVDYLTREFQ
ncbi:carnosine synthase 1 isoform X2 [Bombina bombina]|nr:carnosine synthase 1 isoform X2 [Bombina bombina]